MLDKLKDLRPVVARRVRHTAGGEKTWFFLAEKLNVGEVVRVMPGERIPFDGVIVNGSTCVADTLTGEEKQCLQKKAAEKVSCGMLNCGEAIDVRITSGYAESSLLQLMKRLAEAEAKKSCVQRAWEKVWHKPQTLIN